MSTLVLNIEGMMCDACVGHVTRALQGLAGVQTTQVSLEGKQAIITYDPAQLGVAQVIEAIDEEGYQASARV